MAFREKFYTQHEILNMVNTIETNMDKKMFTYRVFPRFS